MTKVTCDVCGESMNSNHVRISKLPVIEFSLSNRETGQKYRFQTCNMETGQRTIGGPELNSQFDTTDVAICPKCILLAFKEAVAKISA